jgi:hypothetical protein
VDGFVAVGTCLSGRCLACDGSQTGIGRSGLMWVVPTHILQHADLLLGGDREIGDCTEAVVRQRPRNNNEGMVFSARSAKQQM